MKSIERVVIIGGGIGGLCSAIALRQQGVEVTIIEKRVSDFVHGVGIIQPPNALRALKSLGVLDECYAAGFQETRLASTPRLPPGHRAGDAGARCD